MSRAREALEFARVLGLPEIDASAVAIRSAAAATERAAAVLDARAEAAACTAHRLHREAAASSGTAV